MDLKTILVGLALVIVGGLIFTTIWWMSVLMVIVGLAVLVLGFFEG